jgi:hypothetical protein
MKPAVMSKFLEHPDKDEIISKLAMDIPPQAIHDWLEAKYSAVNGDPKIVLPVANLKEFKNTYLDIYKIIKEDVVKTQNKDPSKEMELALKNNKAYRNKINELAGKEVDIKQMLVKMILAVETRAGQVFDMIQENPENLRSDRIAMEWFDHLGSALERYQKFEANLTANNNTVQHQHVLTVQLDQHVNMFQSVVKDILAEMDVDMSMKFMEMFSERMNKLKEAQAVAAPPNNTELRLAEVTTVHNVINNKLQE